MSFWMWAGSQCVCSRFHCNRRWRSQAFSPTTAAWQPEENVYSFSRSLIEVLGNPGLVHSFFFFFPLMFFCFLLQFCTLWLRLASKWNAWPFVTDHSKTTTVELPRPIDSLKNTLGGGPDLRQQISSSFSLLISHCAYLCISSQHHSFSSLTHLQLTEF